MHVEHIDTPDAAQNAAWATLGAVFIDPTAYERAAEIITARDFPDDRDRRVFHAMGELRRRGSPVDASLLLAEIERIGGRPTPDPVDREYLNTVGESALDAVNVEHHARVVADHARRLRTADLGARLAEEVRRSPVALAPAILQRYIAALSAEVETTEAQRPVRLRDACHTFMKRGETPTEAYPWPGVAVSEVEQWSVDPVMLEPGPPQPWEEMARAASLGPDRLAVLTGITGRGKTGFGLQVAAAVAEAGHSVLYASAELGADELVARIVAQRAKHGAVAWAAVLSARPDQVQNAVASAAAGNLGARLHLWTPVGAHRNAAELARVARALQARLVIVDYVQRFVDDGPDKRASVAAMSGALRDLSRPGQGWPGAAVLAISSVARNKYESFASCDTLRAMHPDELVGSGKECGELEYDASLVMCLTADAAEAVKRPAVLRIVKNRHGVPGREIGFTFNGKAGRFTPRTLPPKAAPMTGRGRRTPGTDYE